MQLSAVGLPPALLECTGLTIVEDVDDAGSVEERVERIDKPSRLRHLNPHPHIRARQRAKHGVKPCLLARRVHGYAIVTLGDGMAEHRKTPMEADLLWALSASLAFYAATMPTALATGGMAPATRLVVMGAVNVVTLLLAAIVWRARVVELLARPAAWMRLVGILVLAIATPPVSLLCVVVAAPHMLSGAIVARCAVGLLIVAAGVGLVWGANRAERSQEPRA